jgi:hypothetical protein
MTITELIHALQAELAGHGNLPAFLSLFEGEFEQQIEVAAGPEMARSQYGTLAFPAEKRLLLRKKGDE